jgi:hypothetical protein
MKPAYVVTNGAPLAQVQMDVLRAFQSLGEVCGGTIVKGIAIRTTSTPVQHGLKGKPLGRVITYQSADARVWDAAVADDQKLYLQASAACTVDLWIF